MEFRQAIARLKERMLCYANGDKEWEIPEELKVFNLKLPPWLCQPYVRPSPEEHLKKLSEVRAREREKAARASTKRSNNDVEARESGTDGSSEGGMSKRKMKKLQRNPHKQFPHSRQYCKLCQTCPNPCGTKCAYSLCKKCCRVKCYADELDCVGHRIQVRTKRLAARQFQTRSEKDVSRPALSISEPHNLQSTGDKT